MQAFHSIDEITSHRFIGNHASDSEAFRAIDVFVQSKDRALADKAEALRIMSDKGMGCGRDEDISDEAYVAQYMAELI